MTKKTGRNIVLASLGVITGVLVSTREAVLDLSTGTERCLILNFDQAVKISEQPVIPGAILATEPRFDLELDCPEAGRVRVKDVDPAEWERLKRAGEAYRLSIDKKD